MYLASLKHCNVNVVVTIRVPDKAIRFEWGDTFTTQPLLPAEARVLLSRSMQEHGES